MKKISIFLLLLSSQFVHAQFANRLSLGINPGVSFITQGGNGRPFNLSGDLSYGITPNISVAANIGWTTDAITTITEISANGRYFFAPEEKFKFFAEAGMGTYNFNANFFGLFKANKDYLGVNIGGGATTILPGGLGITAKVKYHNPFINGATTNYINTTIGATIYF